MSMFNNPQFMNMATQLMSDPQMQNVYDISILKLIEITFNFNSFKRMSNLVSSMFNPGAAGSGESGPGPASAPTSAPAPAPGFDQILNS